MNIVTELKYGNPSIDILQLLNAPSYLDILFTDFTNQKQYAFPDNDSSITKNELNDIVGKIIILQRDKDVLTRYQRYDLSLLQYYTDVRFDTKEETEEYHKLLSSIFIDVLPLIFKLKHHYQRPRPFQLAHYYRLNLFPFYSSSADSPSYPCTHACMAHVLAGVLSNHYTNGTEYFNTTATDVGDSRVYMGLNFQSSVDFSKMIADKIIVNPEFVKKYQL